MSADNHQARRLQILARLALVTGLAVAAALVFTDLGSSPSPDRNSSPAERLVSLSSPRPLTRIDSSTCTRPIESIRVGDRVLASNPEVTNAERSSWAEPDWNDWLHLSLQMQMPSRDHQADRSKILDIELLRPQSWLREQLRFVIDSSEKVGGSNESSDETGTSQHALTSVSRLLSRSPDPEQAYVDKAAVPFSPLTGVYREIAITSALIAANGMDLIGLTVQMDMPEMGATGTAVVTDIRSCPAVRPGDGQPVTATFSHPPANAVLDVLFEGESEPIGVTDNHLFWSVDRQQFLAIGKMKLGEHVQTFHGDTKRIEQKLARPGPQAVYNLEVYGEHVYFVGEQGLLAHNSYSLNAPRGTLSPVLQTQKQLSTLANRQADVVSRFLRTSDSRVATTYRNVQSSNPNFAKLIEGRVLDRRLNSILKKNPLGNGVRLDQAVPNSGSALRPDVFFPNLDGKRVIFDFGGPSKIGDIRKFEGLADEIIPIVPVQRF